MTAPVCCSCEAAPGTVRLARWDLCPSCALDYLDPAPDEDDEPIEDCGHPTSAFMPPYYRNAP